MATGNEREGGTKDTLAGEQNVNPGQGWIRIHFDRERDSVIPL